MTQESIVPTIRTHTMKTKEYKVRHIRMDDPIWEELKEKRRQSKLSWNQFIKSLLYERKI